MQNEVNQVRSWAEVAGSEQFRALSPDHQERARELYYQDNVAPRVPKGMEQRARALFDQDTLAVNDQHALDNEDYSYGADAVDSPAQGGIEAMDFVKEAGGGALTGTGAMISGTGDLVRPNPQERTPVETPIGEFTPLSARIGSLTDPVTNAIANAIDAPARAVGEWLSGKGKAISDSKTDAAKEALKASTPTGDIDSPSTWSMGEDPSVAGYGLHLANLAGQFGPQAGAMIATKGRSIQTPAMMGIGGLQAGGSAGDEVEQRITETLDADLQASSGLYQKLRQTMPEQEARKSLIETARSAAFDGAAPVGALGGLATQVALGPLQRSIGGSVGRKLAAGTLIEAPLGGLQEVAETTEARRSTNKSIEEDRSLTEGTFGDFALGALGGTGFSVAGTALSGKDNNTEAAADPVQEDADSTFENTPEQPRLEAPGLQGLPEPDQVFYGDSQGNMQDIGPVKSVDGVMQPTPQSQQWVNPANRTDAPVDLIGGEGMEAQAPRGTPPGLQGQFIPKQGQQPMTPPANMGLTLNGNIERIGLPEPEAFVVDSEGNTQRGATAPQVFNEPPMKGGAGMDQQAPTAPPKQQKSAPKAMPDEKSPQERARYSWDSMNTFERNAAAANVLGMRGVSAKNAATKAWDQLSSEQQDKLVTGLESQQGKRWIDPNQKVTDQTGPVLQNRDRTSQDSINQMRSISNNPDYSRLKTSGFLSDGAPVVVDENIQIPASQVGVTDTASAGNERFNVQYAVVEADQLMTSNSIDGTTNAEYQTGAAGKARAIAGNGRITGLQSAWAKGNASQYKADMAADRMHGIDPAVIEGMRNPILVRLLPQDQVTDNIGDLSNRDEKGRLSPVEQAKTDMGRIDLDSLKFTADGAIGGEAIHQFRMAQPAAERVTEAEARKRLTSAIFQKAYSNDQLTEIQSGESDDAKSILSALAQAAPSMSRLEGAGEFDVRPLITQAGIAAVNAARRGTKLADYVQQSEMGIDPMVYPILEMMLNENGNIRSSKYIGEQLTNMAKLAYDEANSPSSDMFGEKPKRTSEQVIQDALTGVQGYGQINDGRGQESLGQRGRSEPDAQMVEGPEGGRERPADTRQTAPTQPEAEQEQPAEVTPWGKRSFTLNIDDEYGPPPPHTEAYEAAKSAPSGSVTHGVTIRPSGKQWHNLYLSHSDGDFSSVSIGRDMPDNLTELIEKGFSDYDKKQKKQEQVAKDKDAVSIKETAIAKENNLVLGRELGTIIPNTGKQFKSAKIITDHGDGTFTLRGVQGNKQAELRGLSASSIVRAMDRYNLQSGAKSEGSTPETWRKNYLLAKKRATELGLDPKEHGKLPGLVKAIDAAIAEKAKPEAPTIDLTQQTEETLSAESERLEQLQKEEATQKAKQKAAERKQRDRDADKARADEVVDDFQLGQSAEEVMSGMDDIFSEKPADQNKKPSINVSDASIETFNIWSKNFYESESGWRLFDMDRGPFGREVSLARRVQEKNQAGGKYSSAQIVNGFASVEEARAWAKENKVTISSPKVEISKTDTRYSVKPKKDADPKNLYVAHNLSVDNLLYADQLGGLAAPSLAVGNIDAGAFDSFGEITLLADPSMLESSKARTFDADVYTPRHPKAVYDINRKAYDAMADSIKELPGDLRFPDISSLDDSGPNAILYSDAAKLLYLTEQGKAPAAKQKKVGAWLKKAAKLGVNRNELAHDARFQKIALDEMKRVTEELYKADPVIAKRRERFFTEVDENGKEFVPFSRLNSMVNEVVRYQDSGGIDSDQLKTDISKKFRTKKSEEDFKQWVTDKFNSMVDKKRIFKGFTPAGSRKYVDYNLDNIVKEMTRQVQGGEGFNYGVGSIRAMYASEMKSVDSVKARRDKIISADEFNKIKEETNKKFDDVMVSLAPYYKYDADSFSYVSDASQSIAEGPSGWREAFDLDADSRKIITDFVDYLKNLPTEYFETKVGRAVDLSEFSYAIVPKGTQREAVNLLKEKGIKVKTYDPGVDGSREAAIRNTNDILFLQKEKNTTQKQSATTQKGKAPKVKAQDITDALASTPELAGVKVVQSFEDLPARALKQAEIDGVNPGDLNGIYVNGTSYVVADNHATVAEAVRTAVHEEVGHLGIRGLLGDKLTPTMERIYSSMAATASGRKLIKDIRADYGHLRDKDQRQAVAEELVAHLLETGDKPTLVQRFVSKVRELLRAMFPQVKWTNLDVLALGEQSRAWLRRGMKSEKSEKSATGNAGTLSADTDDIRFSFAGQRSETADHYSLGSAQQRIESGENAEAVRQDTGWHKGIDGKWRYEISDHDAKLRKPFPSKGQPWGGVYESVNQSKVQRGEGYGISLGEILDHPALFAAYPHLADLSVSTQKGSGASYASGSPSSPASISIGTDVPMSDVPSKLLHEIQHGIQNIEGFARGGTLETGALSKHITPSEFYQRLAGEVEARNTQSRHKMTAEQRKSTPPSATQDVSDADAIVMFNGTEMHNAPAPANTGTNPDIRYSLKKNNTTDENAELPEETRARKQQRLYQDRFNRFTVIREWLSEKGVKLPEDADVYLAEERMHSRHANKVQDFREKTVKPMIEKIQAAGFTMDEVAQFLHAQHAIERNAQVARINKGMPDGGSGMQNAVARQILNDADKQLVKLANEVRSITDKTRKILIDSGLISQDQADAWQKAYQHYVPLKGGPDDKASMTGTGKGLKAQHKTKRALGHDVREDGEWIVENILSDHERAILAAEKNLIGKHLLKMAINVGIDSIMTVGKPEKRGVLRDHTSYEVLYKGKPVGSFNSLEAARTFREMAPARMGKAVSTADITIRKTNDPSVAYMASPMPAPNEALVYVDGDMIRVQINDELLARAYGNMGADALGTLMLAAQSLNRWLSTVYTAYSPEFLPVNVIRDFTTGLANITGEEGIGFASKTMANYAKSFKELLAYTYKDKESKWIKMYREDGGNTGAAYLSDLERLGSDLQTEYAVYQGVISNLRDGKIGLAARAAGRKAFNVTLRYMEALNEAGENSMRLALYRTAVEQGLGRNRAASLSKNTTVNFNRKGEMTPQLNALYLFFNATVQGTTSIAHAHFKGKHKKQAMALSAGMAALGYTMTTLFRGDDEDEYDKMPDHTKERNLVIPLTSGGVVTLPVPYGYGFFFNFGRLMADANHTGDIDGMAWKLASNFTGEFMPLGGTMSGDGPDMLQASIYALPTFAQIPLSIAANRTSFGSPMRPENAFKKHEPDRLKMWRGTEGTWADSLAGALESVGADVSPETLKHLNRTFTGGAGTFVGAAYDAAALSAQGAEPEAREIPIFRKFYRESSTADARSRFWRYQSEASKAAEDLKRIIDQGDRAKARSFLQENRELIGLDKVSKSFSRAASALRDRVQEVRLSDAPIAQKREQIKKIEGRESELYDKYVRIFKERSKK